MKLTNRLGLPEPIVQAVANDSYNAQGTLSVTTLLKPPQAYALTLKHGSEIVEDAADRIWSLMGQIGHTIVERASASLGDDWITERRFHAEIDGEKVSGQADLVHLPTSTVDDFKFTSGWAVKDAQANGKSEWRMQLSMLAVLARMNGIEITKGRIIAIVRDWTKMQALRNPEWPQDNVAVIDMDILPHNETLLWMETRIDEFKEAVGGNPRPCTDEERWCSPGKWAVYKGTNIKAAKLADSEDELSSWIFANKGKIGSDYRIEERPTEYKRCQQYCGAAPFCPQFQATLAAQ